MKVIILAAGEGSRLRPLTNDKPKCMIEVNGKSIIERQLEVMYACGIVEEDIIIIAGYQSVYLRNKFKNTKLTVLINENYGNTNMVYSLMCARKYMESSDDVLISYGDIIYNEKVLQSVLSSNEDASVVVDDGWYSYWLERCENPLDDAETLMFNSDDYLIEIGQKTTSLSKVQAQYIGLMYFKQNAVSVLLQLADEARSRSERGIALWRTSRVFNEMYMTDLLQGLIDEGNKLKAVHINRGWFEIDDCDDLKIVERQLQ